MTADWHSFSAPSDDRTMKRINILPADLNVLCPGVGEHELCGVLSVLAHHHRHSATFACQLRSMGSDTSCLATTASHTLGSSRTSWHTFGDHDHLARRIFTYFLPWLLNTRYLWQVKSLPTRPESDRLERQEVTTHLSA